MRNLILILVALGLASCGQIKNKYFNRLSDQNFKDYLDRKQVDSLVIDDSYELYVRQICREKPSIGYYSSGNPSSTTAVVRCDCEDPTITYEKERLEIQYLLISAKHKKFIYITTMPPGIYDNKILYDNNLFNIDNYVNINYFNTFFFGDINNNTLNFKIKSPTQIVEKTVSPGMRWHYNINSETKTLEIVKVFSELMNKPIAYIPSNSLQPNLTFYKKNTYKIGICDDTEATKLTDSNNNCLENNTIYFLTKKRKGEKRIKKIAFCFNTSYLTPATPIRKLSFDSFRIMSSPVINL